ncbi:RidA family protein [Moraxella sp. VT-16-12]|uniref:RidA family protein n=1 Tax=Moraxella sp. VT-16-12 TaxID=2014877 RepID=UPI000B7E6AAA|nr:Rid family hydrolase [Moraxella sp. VT-16-12]TWV81586.1 RidA family protein [Moraxella sp. VT-16-12]
MTISHHTPKNLFAPIGPYSHFSQVGNFIQISGTPGVNPKTGEMAGADAYSQSKQILLNFEHMLQMVNADLTNILHIHVFLKNVEDFAEMNRAYAEIFQEHYPARTVIVVADLPKAGALMTMNATAVTSK